MIFPRQPPATPFAGLTAEFRLVYCGGDGSDLLYDENGKDVLLGRPERP